jgi:uncharacterized protein with FMN-binding domain/Pyruvate/2-oxoacid:ferredoxin oxidoreductase delta subunit
MNQDLNLQANYPIFIQVLATILITTLIGRFFCGWMCAFGAFSDWIYAIARRVSKKRIRVSERVDQILKYVKYINLAVLILVLWNLDYSFLETINPWSAFCAIFTMTGMPDIAGAIEYYAFGTVLLFAILVASVFIERFFCRYLCPLGAIYAVTSRLKVLKIMKFRDKCGACRACTNNCPMGIPMYKQDRISSGECIMCMRCTQVCPRGNATLSFADSAVNSAVASTIAVAAIAAVSYTGDLLTNIGNDAGNDTEYASAVAGKYTDGTYEGSGTGFHGGTTTVSVTVENGNISDVEVLSYEDDEPFFNQAEDTVISEIIETQSADVDAVSGATFSSRGIMEAVENALGITQTNVTSDTSTQGIEDTEGVESYDDSTSDNASDSSETPEDHRGKGDGHGGRFGDGNSVKPGDVNGDTNNNEDVTGSNDTATNETSDTESASVEQPTDSASDTQDSSAVTDSGVYADGTYEGSGTGYRNGTTTVSVTVDGGAISNIEVISYEDDEPFFKRAYDTVISDIVDSQSTDVDAVSGATFSSRGIMDAVADALSSARQ